MHHDAIPLRLLRCKATLARLLHLLCVFLCGLLLVSSGCHGLHKGLTRRWAAGNVQTGKVKEEAKLHEKEIKDLQVGHRPGRHALLDGCKRSQGCCAIS